VASRLGFFDGFLVALICVFLADSGFAEGDPSAENRAMISNREVLVPAELIRELERWYLSDFRLRKKDDLSTEAQILANIPRKLLNIVLAFKPKSGNALKEAAELRLPTGGGLVDLANSVTGDQGAFLAQMRTDKLPDGANLRVFYVSGARRGKVLGEEYGVGCGSWLELTSWYNNTHDHEPLEVFAAEQRHIRVMAGTWVFAALREGELHLAAVTLKDSRHPHLQCGT